MQNFSRTNWREDTIQECNIKADLRDIDWGLSHSHLGFSQFPSDIPGKFQGNTLKQATTSSPFFFPFHHSQLLLHSLYNLLGKILCRYGKVSKFTEGNASHFLSFKTTSKYYREFIFFHHFRSEEGGGKFFRNVGKFYHFVILLQV